MFASILAYLVIAGIAVCFMYGALALLAGFWRLVSRQDDRPDSVEYTASGRVRYPRSNRKTGIREW